MNRAAAGWEKRKKISLDSRLHFEDDENTSAAA
jgi:hypothetical protein